MKRVTVAILALVGILLAGSHLIRASQQVPSKRAIVPGVGVGDYTLGMSKDEVLRRLGKPQVIYYGEERYALDNLPRRYGMYCGDISVFIIDNVVQRITAHSPSYTFTHGLGVGDSEDEIKEAFGSDFERLT